MKNKKMNSKGITLIALIITIIVMLILVGVTINVAINGGLFETAKTARADTEKNTILEQLVAMSTYEKNGKIQVGELVSSAEKKFGRANVLYNEVDGILTVTGKYGSYDYILTTEKLAIKDSNDLEVLKVALEGKTMKEVGNARGDGINPVNGKEVNVTGGTEDGRIIISYNGNEYALTIRVEGSTIAFTKVEEYVYKEPVTDADDYFEIKIKDDAIKIIGLTERGQTELAKSKKLVIPKEITGSDGNKYQVTELKDFCFQGNMNIETLEFENGINLEVIPDSIFWYCTNLTGTLNIPSSVKRIEYCAFCDTSITGLTFNGDNLEYIGDAAFRRCKISNNLQIPSNVTYIGTFAFEDTLITGLTFKGTSLITLNEGAFNNCINLTGTLNIPESVETIGNYCFRSTKINGTLNIPNSVKTIGYSCFSYTKINGILNIPESVETIGNCAFNYTEITGLNFNGDKLNIIDEGVFKDCPNLTGTINIPSNITSIGYGAFSGTSITGVTFNGNKLNTIGNDAFSSTNIEGKLNIPESVSSIGSHAFSYSKITGIQFNGNNLTSINAWTFAYCENIKSIEIPESVTYIDRWAFNNSGITEIIINNSEGAIEGAPWGAKNATVIYKK